MVHDALTDLAKINRVEKFVGGSSSPYLAGEINKTTDLQREIAKLDGDIQQDNEEIQQHKRTMHSYIRENGGENLDEAAHLCAKKLLEHFHGTVPSADVLDKSIRVFFEEYVGKNKGAIEALGLLAEKIEGSKSVVKEAVFDVMVEKVSTLFYEQVGVDPGNPKGVGYLHAFAGLCATWDDKELQMLGSSLWKQTRKLDGQSASEAIGNYIDKLYAPAARSKRAVAQTFAIFATVWAVHAFQKIVTTHTYAAALMCSDASRESVEDIEIPWSAFMIVVPDGILADYTRILIAAHAGVEATLVIYSQGKDSGLNLSPIVTQLGPTLADLLFDDPETVLGPSGEETIVRTKEVRVLRLAKRLVAGLLLSMQNQDNMKRNKNPPARNGKGNDRSGPPEHRIVFVGRPLKVDCRPAVRAYLERGGGKRGGPASVQVLVRGHFKRQVIGVSRLGRKVVWIEPYWRGDEEAPILTRPKLVGK
jgi:hypothetical protein